MTAPVVSIMPAGGGGGGMVTSGLSRGAGIGVDATGWAFASEPHARHSASPIVSEIIDPWNAFARRDDVGIMIFSS